MKKLDDLSLAISIIDALMRKDNGISIKTCQAYLTSFEDSKGVLDERDQNITDFPSSIWKLLTFAFRKVLSDDKDVQNTASLAYFIASCKNTSKFPDYLRLYLQFKSKIQGRSRPSPFLRRASIENTGFFENGLFEAAVVELAARNMITLNWIEDMPDNLPHFEMNSLEKGWIRSENHVQIFIYTTPELWLLGLSMYDRIVRGQLEMKNIWASD